MIGKWLEARIHAKPPGRVLSYLMFTDPATGQRIAQDYFAAWGVQHCQGLFHNHLFRPDGSGGYDTSGWIDEDIAKAALANATLLPQNAFAFLNVECDPWKPAKLQGPKYEIDPVAVDLRVRLLEFVHAERPDLQVGHYREVPFCRYDGLMQNKVDETVHLGLVPIAEASDVLFPGYYVQSYLVQPTSAQNPRPRYLEWIERGLKCGAYYPRKLQIPFLWPHYYDQWNQHPELQNTAIHERACRMEPNVWKNMLDLTYRYSDSWFWWDGEGGPPWDELAPCWTVTRDMLVSRGVPRFTFW